MNTVLTPSQRLRRLEQILAESRPPVLGVPGNDWDAAVRQLEAAPFDRIQRITAELLQSHGPNDEVDAVAIRLLLNDYAAAVCQLRTFIRLTVERVDAAADPVGEARGAVRRETRARENRERVSGNTPGADVSSPEPSEAPPA
jgi:hypothetical protein